MSSARTTVSRAVAYGRRPLQLTALLACASLLHLACDDQDTTAPARAALDGAAPAAAMVNVDPITIEPLTGRFAFTDDVSLQTRIKLDGHATNVVNVADPSNVTTLKITVQPGARFPWHTHPGPVIVTVAQGELVLVYAEDCVPRHYSSAAFVDPGNKIHTAYNPGSSTPAVLIATFFIAPASGPLTLALPADQQSALNAQCSTPAAAVHAH